ncbi:hypothetical protein [Corallococcus sp. Z5C101001]|uniref:hypothetical protein n=1 Tax=Corallococcus sp. Z5C101001 TaxID=2596829 RepID=UPI00117DEAED|nr:hypothetical protein [Corallococcus sp. Z5C101001]TSC31725.1 hypothetical protein FOF48_13825 [Corallococcus sp. Z5C101001]
MTTKPMLRLFATPEELWVASLTQLEVYKGSQGLHRRVEGDVEFNRLSNCVLAVAPEAQRIWMGRGAQREVETFGPERSPPRIFTLAEGPDTPCKPLNVELADLVCDGARLIGCQVDGRASLSRILWSDLSGEDWRTLPLPEPVIAEPHQLAASEEAERGAPSGVLLSSHLHGVVAVDPGAGRIAVIRPGSPKVDFVLQWEPSTREEQWFAVPTQQGVLVAITQSGHASTLAHYSDKGALLTEFYTEGTGAVCGLALADADSALVIMKCALGRLELSDESSFAEITSVPLEDAFRFATATAAPGRVWIAPDHFEYGKLAQVRCEAGKPLELLLFEKPQKKGAPLWDEGRTRPRLEWAVANPEEKLTGKTELGMAVSSSVTWKQRFENVGALGAGLLLSVGGRPMESGLVTISVRLNGEAIQLTPVPGLDSTFERRMTLEPRTSGELEFTFHGVNEGSGLVGVELSPWTPPRYLPDPQSFGGAHSFITHFFELRVNPAETP